MGINVLSNDVGYRGVAAATAAGAVLSAVASLQGRGTWPGRPPSTRNSILLILTAMRFTAGEPQ
ncbi:hypothetical protein [Micromonospora sp. DT233]|uniref:hypothetical protein n=1 Tax=Micromonospora sp. DT233 TaxID=3393432 RepID=UPI003CFBB14D